MNTQPEPKSLPAEEIGHTPLPWRFAESKGGQWFVYADDSEQPIQPSIKVPKRGTKLMVANAEFIVRACNAHYELLAACEACWNADIDWIDKTRAAIAKARGTK